jgi:hypothetical protein
MKLTSHHNNNHLPKKKNLTPSQVSVLDIVEANPILWQLDEKISQYEQQLHHQNTLAHTRLHRLMDKKYRDLCFQRLEARCNISKSERIKRTMSNSLRHLFDSVK